MRYIINGTEEFSGGTFTTLQEAAEYLGEISDTDGVLTIGESVNSESTSGHLQLVPHCGNGQNDVTAITVGAWEAEN